MCLQWILRDSVDICLWWIIVHLHSCVNKLNISDVRFFSSVAVVVLMGWFFGALARWLPNCLPRQGLTSFGEGATMKAARLRRAPVLVVVTRWSTDIKQQSYLILKSYSVTATSSSICAPCMQCTGVMQSFCFQIGKLFHVKHFRWIHGGVYKIVLESIVKASKAGILNFIISFHDRFKIIFCPTLSKPWCVVYIHMSSMCSAYIILWKWR